MDIYEGVEAGLYTREKIEVEVLSGKIYEAYIYIPTEKCIDEYDLSLDKDLDDQWLEEIKKNKDVCNKFSYLFIAVKNSEE